ERMEIIVSRVFDRRHFRFADVDADRNLRPMAAAAQFSQPRRDYVSAVVVETEPIDERFLLCVAKDPRPRISRLRFGRDRADLDEAKAKLGPGRDRDTVLVEAGGKSDGIWESETEERCRFRRRLKTTKRPERKRQPRCDAKSA